MKSYTELIKLETYQERLDYLLLYLDNPSNQNRKLMNAFYKSSAWLAARDAVLKRDLGCDLGIDFMYIEDGPMLVHHINPITEDDVLQGSSFLFDMDNLITVSKDTHNTIHYRTAKAEEFIERKPGDTKLW